MKTRILWACLLALTVAPWATAQNMPQVLYYRFNEGSGTTTADFANPGLGSIPTFAGAVTWNAAPPQLGAGCVSFTAGTTDRINTNVALAITGSWTIEMWLYDTSAPTNTTLRYVFGETATTFRLFAGGVAGNNNLILRGNTITDTTVIGAAQQNVWVHVAFVYDSTTTSITPYLNGVAQTPVLQTLGASLSFASPGIGLGGYAGGYGGSIDEFRMWNTARTANDILANMNIELSNSPPKSIRLTNPRPPIFFSPGQGTFTCNGTVASFTDDAGFVTSSSSSDPLIGAAVAITGNYSGVDIIGLSDITLSPCTIQFTVVPGTDELSLFPVMSIAATLGDYVDLAGNLLALPTRFRTIGQIGTANAFRTGAGSNALDRLGNAVLAGESMTLVCPLEGGGPTLSSIERSYTLTPPAANRAFVTDGFGAALIGVVGYPPGATVYNIFALNNAQPVGTGPFFGLPFTSLQVELLSLPAPTNPVKVFANADGAYFWGVPPGSVPAGLTVDLVTIGIAPAAAQATNVSPVTRITF